jgi:hypothetical protein
MLPRFRKRISNTMVAAIEAPKLIAPLEYDQLPASVRDHFRRTLSPAGFWFLIVVNYTGTKGRAHPLPKFRHAWVEANITDPNLRFVKPTPIRSNPMVSVRSSKSEVRKRSTKLGLLGLVEISEEIDAEKEEWTRSYSLLSIISHSVTIKASRANFQHSYDGAINRPQRNLIESNGKNIYWHMSSSAQQKIHEISLLLVGTLEKPTASIPGQGIELSSNVIIDSSLRRLTLAASMNKFLVQIVEA